MPFRGSRLLYDRRSVIQYVLVLSTLVGLATRYYFLSECCCLVSVGRPLWREDGFAICSLITQWTESGRTRNHTSLSPLRLPQPGRPGSCIYILQEQGGPVIPPGTGFPLHRLLWLAALRRKYYNPPRIYIYIYPSGTGWSSPKSKSRYNRQPVNQYVLVPSPCRFRGAPSEVEDQSYYTTDSRSVRMSWYWTPLWDLRPDITSCRNVALWNLRSCLCGAPSLTRGQVCNLQCNHSMVRVAQNPKPYFTASSETPPTW
jgi:hypothetical protein